MLNQQQPAKLKRLQVFFKALIFWMIFIFLLMLGGFVNNLFLPTYWHKLFYGVAGSIAAFIVTYLFMLVDKQSFVNYGWIWQRSTLHNFLRGVVMGTLFFAAMMGLLIAFTDVAIEKSTTKMGIEWLFGLCHILPMALMEEIAFRGYPFIQLNKVFGLRVTQCLVAVVFALYHIIQGWGIEISFLGPGIWAFVFGLTAVWYNSIAVPTGIHFMLNLGQDLLATKGDATVAIWILKKPVGAATQLYSTESVGLVIQIVVFVIALCCTEWYIRKNKHKLTKSLA